MIVIKGLGDWFLCLGVYDFFYDKVIVFMFLKWRRIVLKSVR